MSPHGKFIFKIWHPIPCKLYHMPCTSDIQQSNDHVPCLFCNCTSFYNGMDCIMFILIKRTYLINILYFGKLYIIAGKMKEYITYSVYSHLFKQIFCLFPGMVFRQQISRRCGIPYFKIFRISRGSGIIITVRKFSFVRHHHTCGIRHSLIRHFIGSCCMIGLIGNGIIQICSVPGIRIVFHLPVCKCARTYRLCF